MGIGKARKKRQIAQYILILIALYLGGMTYKSLRNIKLSLIYFSLLALAYFWFHFFVKPTIDARKKIIS